MKLNQHSKQKRATRKSLIEHLEKIGWSVRGIHKHNQLIFNHDGKKTMYRVLSDRVQQDSGSEMPSTCFYFDDCTLEMLDSTTVSLSANDGVFILFANYNLREDL